MAIDFQPLYTFNNALADLMNIILKYNVAIKTIQPHTFFNPAHSIFAF